MDEHLELCEGCGDLFDEEDLDEHVVTAALPATVLVIGAKADLWQLDILTELRRRTES